MDKKLIDMVVIGKYAIKIQNIRYIKVFEKQKKIKVCLLSNEKLIQKFERCEFEICLDNIADAMRIKDYHCPRTFFNRGWRWDNG